MTNWLSEHVVDDWQNGWRWLSVQGTAAGGAAVATIAGYPDLLVTLAAMMGGTPRLQAAVIALVIGVIALRFWKQEESDED